MKHWKLLPLALQSRSRMSPPAPPARFPNATDMRQYSRAQRAAGKIVALVPTMVRAQACVMRAVLRPFVGTLTAA